MADQIPRTEAFLDDPALVDLANAVLDGRPVDWAAAASGPSGSLATELRLLASVIDVHRGAQPAQGQWGPLLLLERIGAGAFGEVYRAWDRRLDREVALKLLFATDGDPGGADVGTSIEEGRLLARVRHPNVVTVYGAERSKGRVGIWMELVRGETLAEQIRSQGPLPSDQAIAVGIDLCGALAAVHRAGLLHRDVKAHNVMREPDGRIVLMDFGAGRETLDERPGTGGASAGTPLYLAPELWDGAPATARSEIYGLGVLLFFLVTGVYPVPGRSPDEVRRAQREGRRIPLRDVRPDLPEAFAEIVERAVAPRAVDRFADADELGAALLALGQPPALAAAPTRRASLAVAAVAVVAIAATLALWRPWQPPRLVPQRWLLNLGAERLTYSRAREVAISPDGRYVAYAAQNTDSERARLFLRQVGSEFSPVEVPGTDGGHQPFFSPDGRRVGFKQDGAAGAGGQMRVVPVDGGPAVTIASWGRSGGAVWDQDGTIVFSHERNLWRIAETGGPAAQLTTLEDGEAVEPAILPGGAIVFEWRRGYERSVAAIPAGGGPVRVLVENGYGPKPLAPDLLVYGSNGIHVAPLDAGRQSVGSPLAYVDVRPNGGWFDVSTSGALVYAALREQERPDDEQRLIWVEPGSGLETVLRLPERTRGIDLVGSRLSPDGTMIANGRTEDGVRTIVIRSAATLEPRSTLPAAGSFVAWTPDSAHVTAIDRGALVNWPIDGGGEREVIAPLALGGFAECGNGTWSPDERHLILRCGTPAAPNSADLWLLTRGGSEAANQADLRPWAATPARESRAVFSPDGRWVAFTRDSQLLVRPATGSEPEVVVAASGGIGGWRKDGLYFLDAGRPVVLSIQTEPELRVGPIRHLAPGFTYRQQSGSMQVAPDGRLLFFRGLPTGGFASQLNLVVHWGEEVRQQMRGRRQVIVR